MKNGEINYTTLVSQIQLADSYFKTKIAHTIDQHLTLRNWLIGFYIVEFEQNGNNRASYGKEMLQTLSKQLNEKGLSFRNLKLFRQFYQAYPIIGQTLSAFFKNTTIRQALYASLVHSIDKNKKAFIFPKEQVSNITQLKLEPYQLSPDTLLSNLSFSHLVELIKVKQPLKRAYYEIECIKGVWSVRELKRQISSLSFERSAASKNPKLLVAQLSTTDNIMTPDELIKTPYVFDFLNLPEGILGSESKLEQALINDLKSFILELGHGFCYEAQQKRIIMGGEYFFIDLVFYHRILKCHVIIELKVDEFNHAHAGQLNTYIQYFKTHVKQENDNPPIGILLCTNQNEELVQYALGGMDKNLFVSDYQTVLPTTIQLEEFLKVEKQKLE